MGQSHAAGWASDAPTPAQLKEFFGQIEKGKVTKDNLQDYLRGKPAVSMVEVLTEAERLAVEILGPGKVLGYRDVGCVQKAELSEVEPVMLLSEDALRECAEANAQGIANWRLSYAFGHPFRREREIMGWNRKKQPCFDPDWTWWLEKSHDFWATASVEPGYRLFDFTKRFLSIRWQDQTCEISKLGGNFERAEEQAVAEICFSNYMLNNGERLMSNWYHWGKIRTAIGYRVCVGYFDQFGFSVYSNWDDYPDDDLGVVLARKS